MQIAVAVEGIVGNANQFCCILKVTLKSPHKNAIHQTFAFNLNPIERSA